jgi:hypothetical protein
LIRAIARERYFDARPAALGRASIYLAIDLSVHRS